MRVNVYAEEQTDRLEIVQTTSENTGASFRGIRFYLESSPKMYPPQHPDDDSSAVTFWVKSGSSGYVKGQEQQLCELLRNAANMLEEG